MNVVQLLDMKTKNPILQTNHPYIRPLSSAAADAASSSVSRHYYSWKFRLECAAIAVDDDDDGGGGVCLYFLLLLLSHFTTLRLVRYFRTYHYARFRSNHRVVIPSSNKNNCDDCMYRKIVDATAISWVYWVAQFATFCPSFSNHISSSATISGPYTFYIQTIYQRFLTFSLLLLFCRIFGVRVHAEKVIILHWMRMCVSACVRSGKEWAWVRVFQWA